MPANAVNTAGIASAAPRGASSRGGVRAVRSENRPWWRGESVADRPGDRFDHRPPARIPGDADFVAVGVARRKRGDKAILPFSQRQRRWQRRLQLLLSLR